MLPQQTLNGLQHVPASAIVGRYGQQEPVILGRAQLRVPHQAHDSRLETFQIADDAKTYTVGVELADFLFKRHSEKLHQKFDFVLRAAPVLAAESKEC